MSYASGDGGHSFADLYPIPGSHSSRTATGLDQDQIFRKISLVLSPAEVLQLCDVVRELPQEVVSQLVVHHPHGSASSPSAPEQLSLVEDFRSQPFATGWAEAIIPPAPCDGYYHSGATTEHSGRGLNTYNSTSSDSLAASDSWNVCVACDQSYALPSGLGKHQRGTCERVHYWKCPFCQHHIFEKLSELHYHHLSIHGGTCPDCCNAVKSSPSDNCKLFLSRCSVKILKKAWGCPCCIDCFETCEDWNRHKTSHQVQNEKVADWSFSTMIRSLLRHRDLLVASSKYNWSLCSWAHMPKTDCRKLKSALERHVLPSDVFDTEADSHLNMPESLVWHVFTLGAVRNNSAPLLSAIRRQTVTNAADAYSNVPVDQIPGFQSADLSFQQQASIEKGHDFDNNQNHQHPADTYFLALDEVVDHEEPSSLSGPPLEYKRATGNVLTKLVDNQGRHRIQQGPAPLASYIPSLEIGIRVPLQVSHHRKRVGHRTPIRKGQFVKYSA